jgi:WD40 repeat protein
MAQYDLFISYSRRDTDFVRQLFGELTLAKRQAWVDWQGIDYSTRWWEEICSGIERADNFVFVLSPDSLNSIYCHREIAHARQRGKRIVTLRCRPIDEAELVGGWYVDPEMRPIESMARENLDAIKAIQWIDYWDKLNKDIPATAQALVQTIDTDPECVRAHTQLLLQAQAWQASGRSPGALLSGDALAQAETRMSDCEVQVTYIDEQRAFMSASRAAQDAAAAQALAQAQRTETLRRRSRQFGVAAVAFAVVTLGALFSVSQARVAVDQASATQSALLATATTVSQEVAEAQSEVEALRLAALGSAELIGGNPITTALLEIRALRMRYVPQSDLWLGQALDQYHILNILSGHTNRVLQAIYSPDGTQLASSSRSGEVFVWDAESGERLMTLREDGVMVDSLAYSPDGTMIAAATRDNVVYIYEVEHGIVLKEFPLATDQSHTVSFSSDSRTVLISELDFASDQPPTATLWNVETGARVRTFEGGGGVISPDGNVIATRIDGVVSLWDIRGDFLLTLPTSIGTYADVAFSPDGTLLATPQQGSGAIHLWSVGSGFLVSSVITSSENPDTIAFSPNGRYLVTSDLQDTTAIIWDIESGAAVRTLRGHDLFVEDLHFSPDGSRMVSAGGDSQIMVWDVDVSNTPRTFPVEQSGMTMAIAPDGSQVFLGGATEQLQFIDLASGERRFLENESREYMNAVAYHPGGEWVASGDNGGAIQVWDARSGRKLAEWQASADPIAELVFTGIDGQLLSASYDGSITLWEGESGARIRSFAIEVTSVADIAISPDGATLAAVGRNSEILRWELATGARMEPLRGHTNDYIATVEFSPDGQYLLSGSGDPEGTVILWDALTGAELRRIQAPRDFISDAVFSPDSRFIAAIAADIIIAGNFMTEERDTVVWDVETGAVVRRLWTEGIGALALAYSADGRYLYLLANGAVSQWDASADDFIAYACSRMVRDFTDVERRLFNLTLPDGSVDMSPTCP